MNVQPSVLIWTVINFCILMLVLNKLLFKPLLAFMDARRKKIDDAGAARENAAREAAEARERAEEERKAAINRINDEAEATLGELRKKTELDRARLERECVTLLEKERADLAAEGSDIRRRLDEGREDILSAFVRKSAF